MFIKNVIEQNLFQEKKPKSKLAALCGAGATALHIFNQDSTNNLSKRKILWE